MSLTKTNNEIVLHINSLIDRQVIDPLNSHEFTTFLTTPIRVGSKQQLTVRCDMIEIPCLFYNFPYYASILWFLEDVGGSNIVRSLQVSYNQNYQSGTELATYLNNEASGAGLSVSFSYSNTTGKITITNNYGSSIRLISSYRYIGSDPFTSQTYNDAMDRLGFTSDYDNQIITAGSTYQADGILRLLRTNCAYLTADIADGSSQRNSLTPRNQVGSNNIIARIPISNFTSVVQYEFADEEEFLVSEKVVNSIKFSLLDDELFPLNHDNSHLTFSLVFKIY